MLNTTNTELHGKRLTDFQLKRISNAYDQQFTAPITGYLSDVFIVSRAAVGVIFGHIKSDEYGWFADGRFIRTSDIRFVRKEGRFWVLTTVNSRYVIATFRKEIGRTSLREFQRLMNGQHHLTPQASQ